MKPKDVNEKIRAYIQDRGLKQTRIAAKAGLTPQKFSAILTAKRRISAEELAAICHAMDADPRLFLK